MKRKANNNIRLFIILGTLFISNIFLLANNQVEGTLITGTSSYSGTLTNSWGTNKYESLDITLWVKWTWNTVNQEFTYQQWSFTIEFDLGSRSTKGMYNDYIRLIIADVTVFADSSTLYEDGESISRTSNYGPIPGAISDQLEISLFIRSYVKPSFWNAYRRCEYNVYWDVSLGRFTGVTTNYSI